MISQPDIIYVLLEDNEGLTFECAMESTIGEYVFFETELEATAALAEMTIDYPNNKYYLDKLFRYSAIAVSKKNIT